MNKYEVALIISPVLSDEEKNAVVENVKGYIERRGGTVTNVDDWGKRRLAYEINKQTEGTYCFIYVDAEPTMSVALEQDLRIMENLLRYLIIRVDE
ncbi:MAG: 30S ribosomal protein S6 [Firmicutes bacterium]|jgi:small subunit ribosomal protein S6|nr:30S ribosomal protein S6 [Bacillota bacterium]MBQ5959938.1 30S ribosomal protein S6 [Bacillota bacterium]